MILQKLHDLYPHLEKDDSYDVDPDLIEENLVAIDAGRRRRLVEQALGDLLVALLLKVKLEISPQLEQEVSGEVSRMRSGE